MKPPGLEFVGFPNGGLTMRVTKSDRVSDAIWDVAQEALDAGWTPEKVKREFAQAWQYHLSERAKDEPEEFLK